MPDRPIFEGPHNWASALVTEVSDHVRALWPREVTGGIAIQIAMRVFARARLRYQSIGLLLAYGQSDDAWNLLRGLMTDAQRLDLLMGQPGVRDALAINWWEDALVDLENRAKAADAADQPRFATTIRNFLAPQRPALEAIRKDLGAGKRPRLPKEGSALARAVGRPEDYLDYVIGSDPGHGALPTAMWHDVRASLDGTDGALPAIRVGDDDPTWRDAAADRATRHFLRIAKAAAGLAGLDIHVDITAYQEQIESRLDGAIEEA